MAVGSPLNVAVIGCGLIGARRATEATRHTGSRLIAVADTNESAAAALAKSTGAKAFVRWEDAIAQADAVVIATPNGYSKKITCAALALNKHVLVEKPMGRNLAEAREMASVAASGARILKIGFNHRYHPAVARAHELVRSGHIGDAINGRARYGHGGRPGYENEWRGNRDLAGGGELTDQGVHIADLFHWFLGVPEEAYAMTQTAVWPLGDLEDNAFGLFRFGGGTVASFHTTWTQWKNLFSLEIFGNAGSVAINGLGKSYGTETLEVAIRNPEGGVPHIERFEFDGPDQSWALEWADFMSAVSGASYLGTPGDGLAAMHMLDALYRSAGTNRPVKLDSVLARPGSAPPQSHF